jgi:hypothetical protein
MNTPDLLRASWRHWLTHDGPVAGPAWLQHAWTFVFCAVVAVGFALLGFAFHADETGQWDSASKWWAWYQANLIVSLCIGYTIRFLFDVMSKVVGAQRLRGWSPFLRSIYFALVPLAGVAIGFPIGNYWATGVDVRESFSPQRPGAMLGALALAAIICFVFWLFFDGRVQRIRAEQRAAEAQLKLLQGQIEPHFLFNTLANVIGLMDHDTVRAKAMLESFSDYLRASFAGLRHAHHTLGDELALVEAYLRVVGTRMDERLRWRVEVPEALRTRALLPLTLQPLVENAVVHGLEPKVEGGEIVVRARLDGDRLELLVEDDGLGLRPALPRAKPAGHGCAIDNIRSRLAQAFGSRAGLAITPSAAGGVCARLHLPTSERLA